MAQKATPKKPTQAQWAKLYEAAAALKQMAPWQALYDMDIITLLLPDRDEPVFCSVMGRAGECFGIGVYPGFSSLYPLQRMASSKSGLPAAMSAFSQDCLMCYYGDREEVRPEDRAVMQALGLKFRGRNQWIYFRSMKPGFLPWFLDAPQVTLMTQALQNLAMACSYILSGKIEIDFEAGETLLRFYSSQQGEWLNAAAPLPLGPHNEAYLEIQDEVLVARLKKQPRNTAKLELDAFYLPMPVQEKKTDAPRLPWMVVLADRPQRRPVDQHLLAPGETMENILADMLVQFILDEGRPAAVYVRDEQMGFLLEDTCKRIGIRLEVGKGMPAIDTLFEALTDFMG